MRRFFYFGGRPRERERCRGISSRVFCFFFFFNSGQGDEKERREDEIEVLCTPFLYPAFPLLLPEMIYRFRMVRAVMEYGKLIPIMGANAPLFSISWA